MTNTTEYSSSRAGIVSGTSRTPVLTRLDSRFNTAWYRSSYRTLTGILMAAHKIVPEAIYCLSCTCTTHVVHVHTR